MKVTTTHVVQTVRKSMGAGTLHGVDGDPRQLESDLQSPVSFRVQNFRTGGKQVELEFPFGPEAAIGLAMNVSMLAETQEAAQELVDCRETMLAVMVGDKPASYDLTEREAMIAAAFFDMGTKVGKVAGVTGDDLRRVAKDRLRAQRSAGRRSPYSKFAAELLEPLDEYIAGGKQSVFIATVREKTGKSPDKKTVRQWADRRRQGLHVWQGLGE